MFGQADLVVDGSFLAESRIDSAAKEVKLLQNRKVEFKKAISNVIPEGWSSIESPPQMEEGTMHPKRIDAAYGNLTQFELASAECPKPGLGSLQVVVSLGQRSLDRYYDKYPDITVGRWKKRDGGLVRKSGILPEYELQLQIDDEDITQKRSKKHRKHWNEIRNGTKPWARFVFYYRSLDSIQGAGCIERPNEVQDLEPGDPDLFVQASAPAAASKKGQEAEDENDEPAVPTAPNRDQPLNSPTSGIVANRGVESTFPHSMFERGRKEKQREVSHEQRPSPRKEPNRRLGGFLNLHGKAAGSGDSTNNRPSATSSFAGASRDSDNTYHPEPTSLGRSAINDADHERRSPTLTRDFENGGLNVYMQEAGDVQNIPARANDGATVSDKLSEASSHAFTNARDGPTDQASFLPSHTLHSRQRQTSATGTSNLNEQVTGDMAADPADIPKIPTTEDIRSHVQNHGMDEFMLNLIYIDAGPYKNDITSNAEFERRRDVVCTKDPSDELWYLNEVYTARHGGGSLPRRDSALHEKQDSAAIPPLPEAVESNFWLGNEHSSSPQQEPLAGDIDWGFNNVRQPSPQLDQTEPEPNFRQQSPKYGQAYAELNFHQKSPQLDRTYAEPRLSLENGDEAEPQPAPEASEADSLVGDGGLPSPRPAPEDADMESRPTNDHTSPQPAQDLVVIKQEEMEEDAPPDAPTPATAPAAAPAPVPALVTAPFAVATPAIATSAPSTPQQRQQPQPTSSTKRPTSERPTSSPPGTQSPSAKRAKAQNSDRKAKLQQDLLAKQAMKEEMKRKLEQKKMAKEAKKKLAEEKRKREAEEIAELERQNAEEDAELAAMEQALMEDDDDDDEDEDGEFEEDE